MQTKYHLSREEKIAAWGEGPWTDEPDEVHLVHHASGYPIFLYRNTEMGNWCAYAGVPPKHPYYGAKDGLGNADVHGGLSFYGKLVEAQDTPFYDHWFFGFDACHAWDVTPGLVKLGVSLGPDAVYRHFRYMRDDAEGLAQMLWEHQNMPVGQLFPILKDPDAD